MFFLHAEGEFVFFINSQPESYLMNAWVKWTAIRRSWTPLHQISEISYLFWQGNDVLSRKSQRILNSDIYGNLVKLAVSLTASYVE